MPSLNPDGSVALFCSYSHKDEPIRDQFEACLALLKRQKLVDIWYDRMIQAGSNWAGEIDDRINTADVIALFVSADFIASDYCFEKELGRALERAQKHEAELVPIIVRACDWEDAPFACFQAVPKGARPVMSWENRDEAWTDVAKQLKVTIRAVLEKKIKKLQEGIGSTPETTGAVQNVTRDAGTGGPASPAPQPPPSTSFGLAPFAPPTAPGAAPEDPREQLVAEMRAKIMRIDEELSPSGRSV